MNYCLKPQRASQFTLDYQPVAGGPRASSELPGCSNRNAHENAHEGDAAVTQLSGVGDPALATPPAFYQHQPGSFTSLSDRIANQTANQAPSFAADGLFEPSGQSFHAVAKALSAAWRSPQSLALTAALAVLVVFWVYRFVAG